MPCIAKYNDRTISNVWYDSIHHNNSCFNVHYFWVSAWLKFTDDNWKDIFLLIFIPFRTCLEHFKIRIVWRAKGTTLLVLLLKICADWLQLKDIYRLMGNVCSPRLGGKDFEIPDLRAKNRYGNTEQIYDDSLVRTVFPISHEENKNSRVLEQIQ